ncbi:MAG: SDR family NAD(P)-dependent oxidoreductase [Pseudomonadota bacterium]
MSIPDSMAGKACLITGGAGSIGVATARQLLVAGARVHLVDRSAESIETARQSLSAFSDRVTGSVADVSIEADAISYVQDAVAVLGRLDFLFCNAGVDGPIAPVTAYDTALFDQVMAVNVRGAFLACKHGLPAMADGGSVLITSSIVGVTAEQGICAYATSKHALIGLMRVAAKESAGRGVRVNVIAPGPIANGFQADVERRLGDAMGRDATALLDGLIPLGRHGHPEEVANMAVFLASPHSAFCTGGVYMVDGGMHI